MKIEQEIVWVLLDYFRKNISRIVLNNILDENTLSINHDDNIKTILVFKFVVKAKDFNIKLIETFLKTTNQPIVAILEFKEQKKLVTYYQSKLYVSEFTSSLSYEIKGITLTEILENLILQINKIEKEETKTFEEVIARNEEQKNLKKQIEVLQKKKQREKQANKKFALHEEIKRLKKQLG